VEGKRERNLEIARQMKSDGEPVDKIQRYTGLQKRRLRGCKWLVLAWGGMVSGFTI